MRYNIKNFFISPVALVSNLLLSMGMFIVCRIVFFMVNISFFPGLDVHQLLSIAKGGFMFDLSALIYINALYILMMAIPLHYKEYKTYRKVAKGVFIFVNSIAIICNLMDSVYFKFTNRRTTASIFNEFSSEGNIGSIIGTELLHYWYLTLIGVILIGLLFLLYKNPGAIQKPLWYIPYYTVQLFVFAAIIPCAIYGIRGGIGYAVRPITISNANQYVNRPVEAAIVLNTPFSIIRTLGKKVYKNPEYFPGQAALNAVFTPAHKPLAGSTFKPLNVVVFILESFGKEYFGTFNKGLDEGTYKGYTPFLDSLANESLTFAYSFANGRKSIDGMPSVLSSIPMFIEPYFLTHYSMNKVSGIAGELKKKGYHTSFFHGAPNGSMGFEAFSRTSGYDAYYGMDQYGNSNDFDGTWAIWDEAFFQFYADKLNQFPQPFTSALFSASSHHPFKIPEQYNGVFEEGTLPIHKCVRYTDYAMKRFFEKASQEPWFKNTLFVITADHTNMSNHPEYLTDCGLYSVPVIFYQPDSELKGHLQSITQQIDIMPTILGHLGYDQPFISFGRDVLHTPPESGYAVNYNNQVYQYFKGTYMIQFDGEKTIAVYDFINDKLLKNNLLNKVAAQQSMETELKAIIQQYIERMLTDGLTVK